MNHGDFHILLKLKKRNIMKLNFNKVQCFSMPEKFYQLLNTALEEIPSKPNAKAITLNFRDPSYSVELGGYHPVEVRLELHNQGWQLVYITDFSFQGSPFPELVKEIDICFISKQVFSLFGGWLNHKSSKELMTIFISNFIEYHAMKAYQTSVSFE